MNTLNYMISYIGLFKPPRYKMGNSENQNKISQWQYNMLLRCSEKGDLTEWNDWRELNPEAEIWLMGANFKGAYLVEANLENARLHNANFKNAILMRANLAGALLLYTDLEEAELWNANLAGAELFSSYLQSTKMKFAFLDDKTIISDCLVDKQTDCCGVGLGNIRIDPGTRHLLEYNIRRLNWEEWYKSKWYRKPVRWFWWVSDYGMSTPRILWTFAIISLLFAVIYYFGGILFPPGLVQNLFMDDCQQIPGLVVPWRAFYLSTLTMTSFGDIQANPASTIGYVMVVAQVILGYVLLGALITRLGILFTAGGPSAQFAPHVRYIREEKVNHGSGKIV